MSWKSLLIIKFVEKVIFGEVWSHGDFDGLPWCVLILYGMHTCSGTVEPL